jgi:hypothetical protein
MRKAGTQLLAIFFLMSSVCYIAHSTQAGLLTEVYVDVIEPFVEINVEPGSLGQGVINANVTCENFNAATPLIVSLYTESTIGSSTLDKPQIVFQGGHQSEVVKVSILVPIITSSASDDHKLTITGIWQQGGTEGPVNGDYSQIIILPYYFPIISSDDPEQEVNQGDEATFNLLVNNTGNINDIYRFEIEDGNQFEEDGIEIETLDRISLGEGGSQKTELSVKTSSETPIKTYGINLILTSVGSEEDSDEIVSVQYLLNLKVNEKVFGIGDIPGSILPLIIIIVLIIGGIVGYQRRKTKQPNPK